MLGIWEWGCPKRGDAQNAVTADAAEEAGVLVDWVEVDADAEGERRTS